MIKGLAFGVIASLVLLSPVQANGVLDGRIFQGLIGPVEKPDSDDSLHFSDGHFWSDICTRCGFQPGTYTAEETDEGVVFRGILQSDSRGQFDYEGLVRPDGTITVSIQWERKRWYWTSRREIGFQGRQVPADEPPILSKIKLEMAEMDPSTNPMCARF